MTCEKKATIACHKIYFFDLPESVSRNALSLQRLTGRLVRFTCLAVFVERDSNDYRLDWLDTFRAYHLFDKLYRHINQRFRIHYGFRSLSSGRIELV